MKLSMSFEQIAPGKRFCTYGTRMFSLGIICSVLLTAYQMLPGIDLTRFAVTTEILLGTESLSAHMTFVSRAVSHGGGSGTA